MWLILSSLFSGSDRVFHQHCYRQQTDAAGDGSEVRGFLNCVFPIHIADECRTTFLDRGESFL